RIPQARAARRTPASGGGAGAVSGASGDRGGIGATVAVAVAAPAAAAVGRSEPAPPRPAGRRGWIFRSLPWGAAGSDTPSATRSTTALRSLGATARASAAPFGACRPL